MLSVNDSEEQKGFVSQKMFISEATKNDYCENSDSEDSGSEEIPKFSQPIFLLNRNKKDQTELKAIFEKVATEQFPEVEDIQVVWCSIFGKDDRPHSFIIFNRTVVNNWMYDAESFSHDGLTYEVSGASGCTAKGEEEPCKLHYKNVPGTDENKDDIETTLKSMLFPVAEVKSIYFPKNWSKRGEVFVEFFDEESASYALRVTMICEFRALSVVAYPVILRGSYARIQKPRESPSSTESPSPNPLKKSLEHGSSNKEGYNGRKSPNAVSPRPSQRIKVPSFVNSDGGGNNRRQTDGARKK